MHRVRYRKQSGIYRCRSGALYQFDGQIRYELKVIPSVSSSRRGALLPAEHPGDTFFNAVESVKITYLIPSTFFLGESLVQFRHQVHRPLPHQADQSQALISAFIFTSSFSLAFLLVLVKKLWGSYSPNGYLP
jgi:hypothetical protein